MNELFKNKYRIPTIRLSHWDYARDARYFITICVQDGKIFFGEIIDGQMLLNKIGKIVNQAWLAVPKHFLGIYLDEYIIMPNHLHGVLDVQTNYEEYKRTGKVAMENMDFRRRDKACLVSTKDKNIHYRWQNPGKGSLSTIIGSFKSTCTREINRQFPHLNFAWQTRFFDHIIRNDKSFFNIQQYIRNNPSRWEEDRNNPANLWM